MSTTASGSVHIDEPGDLSQAARWGIVAAAFLSTFTCFGIVFSFGAFFD